MFDKKHKSCVKRIHLVTNDGLCDRKAFYKVKRVCLSSVGPKFRPFLICQANIIKYQSR